MYKNKTGRLFTELDVYSYHVFDTTNIFAC